MIYLNGRLTPRAEVCLDPADRGLLLGDGLFETLPSHGGQTVRLDAHLKRLEAGAGALGISLPCPLDDLRHAVVETLAANGLEAADAVLRITLTRGPGPRGLLPPTAPAPTWMITAAPLPPADPAPARAIIATTRRNEHSPLAKLKTLNYLDSVLARREAEARGATDALLLNTAGRLACASAANLFLVRGRKLLTPPPGEGVLPGVTRAAVLELAEAQGLSPAETPLERSDLQRAQEAFLSNSLIGLRPLVEVEGKAIGDGRPGPVTGRLREAYEQSLL